MIAISLVALAQATSPDVFHKDLSELSNAELEQQIHALKDELQRRKGREGSEETPTAAPTPLSRQARFQYVHKKTYATGDPEAAALFLRDHFGAIVDIWPVDTDCNDTDPTPSGYTHTALFEPTRYQPKGFTFHFVRNDRKPPQGGSPPGAGGNVSVLNEMISDWRNGFERGFDQWVDNHLGLSFESLDPLIESWEAANVPYICRTWCCGPGMPQYPDNCPSKELNNTGYCEMGCYVEIGKGLILEALCGLDTGEWPRTCLTLANPEVFDLCSYS